MRRSAQVDARAGRLFVSSWSRTVHGTGIQDDWVEAAAESVDDQQLGGLVRSALAASRVGVPYLDFRQGPTPGRLRLLKLAGARSEAQYARGTRSVSIDWEEAAAVLQLTPYQNGGSRKGFTEMLDRVTTSDIGVSNAELGAAVRRALSEATDGT